MSVSQDAIKQAILDERPLVRDFALRYFTDVYSQDESLLPLAWEAIVKHGEHAFSRFDLGKLAANGQTAAEAVEWLKGTDNLRPADPRYLFWMRNDMRRLLDNNDAHLLPPLLPDIEKLTSVDPQWRQHVRERIALLDASADGAWNELEGWAEQQAALTPEQPVDWDRGERLMEVIVRRGSEADRARVLEGLQFRWGPTDWTPRHVVTPLLIRAAGQWRMAEAAGRLVEILEDQDIDSEVVWEAGAAALARIGGEAVLAALLPCFGRGGYDDLALAFHLSELRVANLAERIRPLLPSARGELADEFVLALARQLALPEWELAYDFTRRRPAGAPFPNTLGELAAAARLLGQAPPELEAWEQRGEAERARLRTLRLEDLRPLADEPFAPEPIRETATIYGPEAAAGRNDPCPCGSGKKYKKCCLRKPAPLA